MIGFRFYQALAELPGVARDVCKKISKVVISWLVNFSTAGLSRDKFKLFWVFPATVNKFQLRSPNSAGAYSEHTLVHTHTEYIIDNPFYLSKRALIIYV